MPVHATTLVALRDIWKFVGGFKLELAPNMRSIAFIQVDTGIVGTLNTNHVNTWNIYNSSHDVSSQILIGGHVHNVVEISIVKCGDTISKPLLKEARLVTWKVCPKFAVKLSASFREKTMPV
jgi:hypothetical protein